MRRSAGGSSSASPREYFAEAIPYREPPDGSGYLLLSAAYAEVAATARARGWKVTENASHHYAMLTEPSAVVDAIEALAQ
jgi:hypothetical protein